MSVRCLGCDARLPSWRAAIRHRIVSDHADCGEASIVDGPDTDLLGHRLLQAVNEHTRAARDAVDPATRRYHKRQAEQALRGLRTAEVRR